MLYSNKAVFSTPYYNLPVHKQLDTSVLNSIPYRNEVNCYLSQTEYIS